MSKRDAEASRALLFTVGSATPDVSGRSADSAEDEFERRWPIDRQPAAPRPGPTAVPTYRHRGTDGRRGVELRTDPGMSKRGRPAEQLVVIGQGYVGLPLAIRAAEVGYEVVGFDLDTDRVKRALRGHFLRRGHHRPAPGRRAGSRTLSRRRRRRAVRRLRRRRHRRAHPTHRRGPQPLLRRGGRHHALAPRSPGQHRDPRVDQLPGHHRGTGRTDPRGRVGPGRRARLPPRATARSASIPATPPGRSRTRPRWCPASTPPPWRPWPPSTTGSSTARSRCPEPARPSSPSCSRTPSATSTSLWSTSWPCLPPSSDIDVWEAIDAASTKPFGYPPLHPGAGRRRPLPAHRPELPVVEGAPIPRPAVPLRRAGQRRQRAHARLRGPAAHAGLQPDGPGRQRLPGPDPRPGLQAQHRRRP